MSDDASNADADLLSHQRRFNLSMMQGMDAMAAHLRSLEAQMNLLVNRSNADQLEKRLAALEARLKVLEKAEAPAPAANLSWMRQIQESLDHLRKQMQESHDGSI